MELFEALYARRSVRKYRTDPVSRDEIMTLLKAADVAPSAMNHKPWEFIVVTGEKVREMTASFGRVIGMIKEIKNEELPDDLLHFAQTYGDAPAAIVVLRRKARDENYNKAYLESASAAMQNLLLAATARGFGTCWMTGPLMDEPELRRILSVPEDREFVAITPLGYPAELPPPHTDQDAGLLEKIRWVS